MTSNILVCVWVNFQMSTSPVFYLKCSNIKMASSAYHMKAHCEFSGTSSEDSNRYRVKRSLNCKQEACFTFPQSSFFLVWVSQTLANLWSWGIYNSIKCQKYGILSYQWLSDEQYVVLYRYSRKGIFHTLYSEYWGSLICSLSPLVQHCVLANIRISNKNKVNDEG